MADAHEILSDYKRVAAELGRSPSKREYLHHGRFGETTIRTHFGGLDALKAAAFGSETELNAKTQKTKMGGAVKNAVDSLIIHTLDLEELFRKAGNPLTLKLLAMPDTHVEHMDVRAVRCFLKFAAWYQPHAFMIMGDFVNAGGLSHWEDASLDAKRIVPELIRAHALLDEIASATPKVSTRIFLEGNHEDWINRFVGSMNNPQLFDGLEKIGYDFSVPGLLKLKQFGYDFYRMSEFVKIGDAHFVHGFYTGVNHPRKHLLKLKGNVFYGHLHDEASDTDSGLGGLVEAQSLGCLCTLRPKFLRGTANNWTHNLGAFEFFPDGTYHKVVPRIRDGRLSFCGHIFDGR